DPLNRTPAVPKCAEVLGLHIAQIKMIGSGGSVSREPIPTGLTGHRPRLRCTRPRTLRLLPTHTQRHSRCADPPCRSGTAQPGSPRRCIRGRRVRSARDCPYPRHPSQRPATNVLQPLTVVTFI